MKKSALCLSALLLSLMSAGPALAGEVVYGGTSGYERISKGVFDLGLDNILLISYISTTEPPETPGEQEAKVSTLKATYVGGLSPRYFLISNLSLGLSLNFFYGRNKETVAVAGENDQVKTNNDLGFIGFLTLDYSVRLGHSLFFRPGIGVGGFYGVRQFPTAREGVKIETTLYGGAGRLMLGFVFYASPHFNLRAGIDLILRAGAEKPAGADGDTFVSVDGGFNVGFGYSF